MPRIPTEEIVTDKNGGLTKAIETKISDKIKITPAEVKKIWDARANQEGVYNADAGIVERPPSSPRSTSPVLEKEAGCRMA